MYINREIQEGLTFDDVLLIPARSEVLPREVDVTTKFTRDITLCTPIVSAAMDTVTESAVAIAMAREGGIGVIHKNMPIEEQILQIKRVKRAENGMIYDPITISPEKTVGDAFSMMSQHHIGGIRSAFFQFFYPDPLTVLSYRKDLTSQMDQVIISA